MSNNDPISYLKGFGEILLKIEAADGQKKSQTLDQGMEASIKLIVQQANLGKKIVFIGNGGSAAMSSHLSVDFWKNGGMRAIAFNDASLLTCISNDYGYPFVFEKPIEMFMDPGDVLIAISSSGKSENILRGVKAARAKKCAGAITFSGFKADNPLRELGDVNFYVPTAPGAYGFVELAHEALIHCISDVIIARKLVTWKPS